MKVLVTGCRGQLGTELARHRWPSTVDVVSADRRTVDVTDRSSIERALDALAPDVVLNAAAYTAVDQAEAEPEVAAAVNATAVAHLARAAERHRFRLVHFSTDYVFDGTTTGWYTEDDRCAPINVYGRTKRDGEVAALTAPGSLVLRTSWVYAAHGTNFVRTMLRLAGERSSLAVVADQVGCPTSAADLAAAVAAIVTDHGELSGLYHLASPSAASWYDLAVAVLAPQIDRGAVEVRPVSTGDYPTAARRPATSRLDSTALQRATGIALADWRTSLSRLIDELGSTVTARSSR